MDRFDSILEASFFKDGVVEVPPVPRLTALSPKKGCPGCDCDCGGVCDCGWEGDRRGLLCIAEGECVNVAGCLNASSGEFDSIVGIAGLGNDGDLPGGFIQSCVNCMDCGVKLSIIPYLELSSEQNVGAMLW